MINESHICGCSLKQEETFVHCYLYFFLGVFQCLLIRQIQLICPIFYCIRKLVSLTINTRTTHKIAKEDMKKLQNAKKKNKKKSIVRFLILYYYVELSLCCSSHVEGIMVTLPNDALTC